MKIKIVYKGLDPIEFDYENIEKIEEIEFEDNKSILIILKDSRKILLPISKQEFEAKINESKGFDILFEFDI